MENIYAVTHIDYEGTYSVKVYRSVVDAFTSFAAIKLYGN
jgi:hypothetical protein